MDCQQTERLANSLCRQYSIRTVAFRITRGGGGSTKAGVKKLCQMGLVQPKLMFHRAHNKIKIISTHESLYSDALFTYNSFFNTQKF